MATATNPTTSSTTAETMADLLDQLGGIAPGRVRMVPPPGTATEADLIAVNARKRGICELVDGVLVEKGMGYPESTLALFLGGLLNAFVIPRNLGIVSGPDGMIRLFPGLIREPDLAFVSWDRVPGRIFPMAPIAGFVPELAIEILSPSNTKAEMTRKRREYFAAGVRLVWQINPRTRTIAVYLAPETSQTLTVPMVLEGGEVLPGFALPLTELFGALDRQAD